jgi:hypothetical protein
MPRSRAVIGAVLAGLLAGSLIGGPVVAHDNGVLAHLIDHLKQRFHTKPAANARFLPRERIELTGVGMADIAVAPGKVDVDQFGLTFDPSGGSTLTAWVMLPSPPRGSRTEYRLATVRICYLISNGSAADRIDFVQVGDARDTGTATVAMDGTDRTATLPECFVVRPDEPVAISGQLLLDINFDFDAPSDDLRVRKVTTTWVPVRP